MNLFQLGNFALNSGAISPFKIECDALIDEDIKTLAEMIRAMVGPFCAVSGVPRGGLRLAEALKRFITVYGPHLFVDDVFTTGGSLMRFVEEKMPYWRSTTEKQLIGSVVFARGQCPHWVKPLFQMPEVFWPQLRGAR